MHLQDEKLTDIYCHFTYGILSSGLELARIFSFVFVIKIQFYHCSYWLTVLPLYLGTVVASNMLLVGFAPEFQCYYFCESSCLFYLSLNSDFYVSKIMHL